VAGPIAPPIEPWPSPATARIELSPGLPPEEPGLDERTFRRGIVGIAGAAALFFVLRLTAWPPHEDETLALYVADQSLGGVLETVLGERGGAPLHFLFAWVVAHVGGGLAALRFVSAVFAVASIPLVALIARRLGADRSAALLATGLAASSWVFLFHALYGRMYSMFLFTSALSYLALLRALDRGGRRAWAAWAAAILLTVATHPYGALVLASQGVFVLAARVRLREAITAFAVVGILGIPFWITDLVLAGRFDVGLGSGGERLGSPFEVAAYLRDAAADASAGVVALPVVLALAAIGLRVTIRRAPKAALLVAAVVVTPTLAFLFARLGARAAPETRHLIFGLPFFATMISVALVHLARTRGPHARQAVTVATALLLGSGVLWAWDQTPHLFVGEPAAHAEGRHAAAAFLAATGRPDDILLGYEPAFREAWERSDSLSRLVLPRADADLALAQLEDAPRPLGRGVWVLDAWDTGNKDQRLWIPARRPRPADAFEVRAFGPYLVIRTVEPTRTVSNYLRRAAAAMIVGKGLYMGDADVNFLTISHAAELIDYVPSSDSRSRSTSSR
jgi:hypothetical protein